MFLFHYLDLPCDYSRAYSLFEKASNAQHTEATYWLAMFYKNGWGVRADPNRALILFYQAADNGFQPAINFVKAHEKSKEVQ